MAFDREEDNFNAFLDALEESVEEGPDSITPITCPRSGCQGEIMRFDYTWGYYECPICGLRVNLDDADKFLHDILDGKYEEE